MVLALVIAGAALANGDEAQMELRKTIWSAGTFVLIVLQLFLTAAVLRVCQVSPAVLLTNRLISVTKWIKNHSNSNINQLPIGYFGASTGAASALSAASKLGKIIKAVVSRGGRPDLAMEDLNQVITPTLLLVGSNDSVVIELNQKAKANISGICELKIIERATHLFPEPGKLDLVAKETSDWFDAYLIL